MFLFSLFYTWLHFHSLYTELRKVQFRRSDASRDIERYLHEHQEDYKHHPVHQLQRANLEYISNHHPRWTCNGIRQMEGPKELSDPFQIYEVSSCTQKQTITFSPHLVISTIDYHLIKFVWKYLLWAMDSMMCKCIHTCDEQQAKTCLPSRRKKGQELPWCPIIPGSFHSHFITTIIPCNNSGDSFLQRITSSCMRFMLPHLIEKGRIISPLQGSNRNLQWWKTTGVSAERPLNRKIVSVSCHHSSTKGGGGTKVFLSFIFPFFGCFCLRLSNLR